MKQQMSIKTVAAAAVLVAMNIILSRVFAINVGPTLRITISTTPIFLAGLWFGPLTGAVCGATGDLLGSLFQGYAPNPLITAAAVLCGLLPGLMNKYLFHGRINYWKVLLIAGIHGLAGSMGLTLLGLHLMYGRPMAELFVSRGVQTAALVIVNSILVNLLYSSPLTALVNRMFFRNGTRAGARRRGTLG